MRILSVAPYVPFPGIPHAGGSYLLHHLEELSKLGNRVTLLAPGSPNQLAAVPRAPAWLDVVTGPPVLSGRSPVRVFLDGLYRRAMLAPPAPTAESLRSVRRAGLVERARAADLVELHWAEYARFASHLRRARVSTPVCVIEHDVDLAAASARARRYGVGYRRLLGIRTAPLVREIERRGLVRADLVAVFKAADEQVLRQVRIATPVQIIDPWLDDPTDSDAVRRPHTVLFTGALWRQENETGILWFLDRVWPSVSASVGGAKLLLVGAGASERLVEAARRSPGTELVGEVPDLIPFYRSAAVFVAPLFVAGGLKFKVPQAMLCGLPVVATSIAAAGVAEVAPIGTFWAVTDEPRQMADALAAALLNQDQAVEVGRNAARWCRDFYSFPRSVARLHARYVQLAGASQ